MKHDHNALSKYTRLPNKKFFKAIFDCKPEDRHSNPDKREASRDKHLHQIISCYKNAENNFKGTSEAPPAELEASGSPLKGGDCMRRSTTAAVIPACF